MNQDHSDEQFEALVAQYYQGLFKFAMSLTRGESDARDLTQHTFYVWATKGHQLRDQSKIKTWLFTTLHRAFLQSWRRQSIFVQNDSEEASDHMAVVLPAGPNRADCAQVLPALAKVDQSYQAAVALFYLEDYAYKDIAEILSVPIGTVKSRIARGILQLREILLSTNTVANPAAAERDLSATSRRELLSAS